MNDQKNTLLFIVLSAVILIGWQLWFGMPQQKPMAPPQNGPSTTAPGTPPAPGAPPTPVEPAAKPLTREEALAQSPRVSIQTPRLSGSVSLKGGRIDDLSLTQYRETVDPKSPPIVLLAPSGSPHPLYAQWGWIAPSGTTALRWFEWTTSTEGDSTPLKRTSVTVSNRSPMIFTKVPGGPESGVNPRIPGAWAMAAEDGTRVRRRNNRTRSAQSVMERVSRQSRRR